MGEKEDMKDKKEESAEESAEASADSQAQSDEELETTEESSEASSDQEESAEEPEVDPPQDDESASVQADADGASGDGGDDDNGDGDGDGDDNGADDEDGDDEDGDDEDPEEPSSDDESEESEETAAAGVNKPEEAEAASASAEEELDPDEPAEEELDPDEPAEADQPEVGAHTPGEAADLRGVAAFFEHPKHLMAAATYARDSDYEEFEAYSPFPIHGMDEAMGLGRSWIPWVTFGAGSMGFVLANMLQFGMMTFDWPMIVGGKPFAPWPSFVPIMFELTVLLAGVTTAVVMLIAAGCFKKPTIIDPRITDDRFVLWISAEDTKFDEDEVTEFLSDLNPLEVRKIVKDA